MRFAVPLIPLFALAACEAEPDVDVRNASVEEVANEVSQATGEKTNFIRPGQWSSTMTVEELSLPGMPPEAAERMKSMMGAGRSTESCLTEEEAQRPQAVLAGRDNQCRYDHFKMGGGKIDAKMRCAQGGVTQVMEMDGSYSPESYAMEMTTTMEGAGAPNGMTMRMQVEAKRVGECTATTT